MNIAPTIMFPLHRDRLWRASSRLAPPPGRTLEALRSRRLST